MSNHVKQRDLKRGGSRHTKVSRYRKTRPKTFASEELAKKWAKDNSVTDYILRNLKSEEAKTKKIQLITKENTN
jgi:hypothetical protein